MAEMSKKDNVLQAIKFALFSASAGIIQVLSFTLLNELIVPNIHIENEKVMNILSSEYGVCYLIALVLSVIWNFTFNRKYTFKSAVNIPVAMLKVFGFYCVFTPVSTIIGELVSRNTQWEFAEYIILGATMVTNMVTEYLFCRFVVYKDSMNTLEDDEDEEDEEQEESAEKAEKEAVRKAKKKARKQEKRKRRRARRRAKRKEKKEIKKAKKKAKKQAEKEAEKAAEKAEKEARKNEE